MILLCKHHLALALIELQQVSTFSLSSQFFYLSFLHVCGRQVTFKSRMGCYGGGLYMAERKLQVYIQQHL